MASPDAAARAHYDALETRDPSEREESLFARLPRHLEHARDKSAYHREILKDIDVGSITSRAALARACAASANRDWLARIMPRFAKACPY